jgi:hypothetical protein
LTFIINLALRFTAKLSLSFTSQLGVGKWFLHHQILLMSSKYGKLIAPFNYIWSQTQFDFYMFFNFLVHPFVFKFSKGFLSLFFFLKFTSF